MLFFTSSSRLKMFSELKTTYEKNKKASKDGIEMSKAKARDATLDLSHAIISDSFSKVQQLTKGQKQVKEKEIKVN